MEAKEQKKLTYEELSKKFGDLYSQYQQLSGYVKKLQAALDEQSFNQASFFLSMLFKVMEHPEMYSDEFVKWSVENIESAMKTFSNIFANPEAEDKKEEK